MKLQDYWNDYSSLRVKKNLKGKEALEAVKKNGLNLRFVSDQTEEICLEAVRQDGYALKYVNEQTENICLEAVRQDGYALKYVNKQTEAICLEAIKQHGYALHFVSEHMFTKDKGKVEANGKAVYISKESAKELGL